MRCCGDEPQMRIEIIGMRSDRVPWREPEGAAIAARAAASLLACIIGVLVGVTATAQTPSPDVPPSAPASAPARPAPQGFVDALGNWVQRGVADVGAGFGAMVGTVGGQATQAAKGAADAARDAATGVTKLPVTGITAGNERCFLAPNGAPDCGAAAQALCRAKGYEGGTSVDFVTVEKCPPRYRVSGRDAPAGVCTMEHFVTKALCQ